LHTNPQPAAELGRTSVAAGCQGHWLPVREARFNAGGPSWHFEEMEQTATFSEVQYIDRKHRTRIFYTSLLLFIGVLFVVSTQLGQRQILPFEDEVHETGDLQVPSSDSSPTLKLDSVKVFLAILLIFMSVNFNLWLRTLMDRLRGLDK
jgi:hypothetical protein